ncbi:MAG: hypothetical protein J6X44_11290 [Thermoguttaceae bacterium]|nr:hypothetical protein [Thermoguttaceae bacterium]
MNAFRRIADTFSKSKRQNALKGRSLRFEPLEDRALLSVGAATLNSSASESSSADVGLWRVERDGSTSYSLVVPFKLMGSATWNSDYKLYNCATSAYMTLTPTYNATSGEYEYWGAASFSSGVSSLDFEVRALADSLQEPTENAVLTLVPPAGTDLIGSGTAYIDIVDANSWLVQIAATDSVASTFSLGA